MKAHIVLSRTRGTWQLRYMEKGQRKQKQVGTLRDWSTKDEAEEANRHLLSLYNKNVKEIPTITALIEQYRLTTMPQRASTRRGYEIWIRNYILPMWGSRKITDLRPGPVEAWLSGLPLRVKSKRNIRGILTILWNFAMKEEYIPIGENPIKLVTLRKQPGERRVSITKDLTADQFQSLIQAIPPDVFPCLHTMWTIHLSLGLRISEVLGLKWKDVDWLGQKVTIERAVVKQIVDDVKTDESKADLPIGDDLVELLKQWRQASQFCDSEDWIFASPWKLGRQPLSYTYIWESLNTAAKVAGIGHMSSHAFRHSYRTWLDAVGTPVGIQQRLMRHSDIRTTMNVYGSALKSDMRAAHEKVAKLARVGGRQ